MTFLVLSILYLFKEVFYPFAILLVFHQCTTCPLRQNAVQFTFLPVLIRIRISRSSPHNHDYYAEAWLLVRIGCSRNLWGKYRDVWVHVSRLKSLGFRIWEASEHPGTVPGSSGKRQSRGGSSKCGLSVGKNYSYNLLCCGMIWTACGTCLGHIRVGNDEGRRCDSGLWSSPLPPTFLPIGKDRCATAPMCDTMTFLTFTPIPPLVHEVCSLAAAVVKILTKWTCLCFHGVCSWSSLVLILCIFLCGLYAHLSS